LALMGPAMTAHIAIANQKEAVLFSDSQGSTDREESHGLHKQYVGENFAVGAAGHSRIIMNLFEALNENTGPSTSKTSAEICIAIEEFFEKEVRKKYWDAVEVLLLTTEASTCAVRSLTPGMFSHFCNPRHFATTGAGSEFVDRAVKRHRH